MSHGALLHDVYYIEPCSTELRATADVSIGGWPTLHMLAVCPWVYDATCFGTKNGNAGGAMEHRGGSAGIGCWGFGSILAVTISWSVNHSILWMILHGILSWIYIIYYAIKR
jgi:hypothetical protein